MKLGCCFRAALATYQYKHPRQRHEVPVALKQICCPILGVLLQAEEGHMGRMLCFLVSGLSVVCKWYIPWVGNC